MIANEIKTINLVIVAGPEFNNRSHALLTEDAWITVIDKTTQAGQGVAPPGAKSWYLSQKTDTYIDAS